VCAVRPVHLTFLIPYLFTNSPTQKLTHLLTYLFNYSLTHLLTHPLTCLLHGTIILEKLTGSQLVKKFPTFYGTRRFITAFTSARHLSLPWASSIQSIYPNPTGWRSILILSSNLRMGLPSCLFPSGFPTKTLYTPLPSSISATCLTHLTFDVYYKTLHDYLFIWVYSYLFHTYVFHSHMYLKNAIL